MQKSATVQNSETGFSFNDLRKLNCPMSSLLRKSSLFVLEQTSVDFQGDVIIKPLTTQTACSMLLDCRCSNGTIIFDDLFLTYRASKKRSTDTHTCVEIFEIDPTVMPLRMFKNGLTNYYTFMIDNKTGVLSDVFTCTGKYTEPRIKSPIRIIDDEDAEHTPDEIAFASTMLIILKFEMMLSRCALVTKSKTKLVIEMKKGKRRKIQKKLFDYYILTHAEVADEKA